MKPARYKRAYFMCFYVQFMNKQKLHNGDRHLNSSCPCHDGATHRKEAQMYIKIHQHCKKDLGFK